MTPLRTEDEAAGVFRGAQPDPDSVRRGLSRGSGRRGCSLGGIEPAGNTVLRARDGIPVAPVSGNHHMPLVCTHTFCFRGGPEGVMNGLSTRGPGAPPFLPMLNDLL